MLLVMAKTLQFLIRMIAVVFLLSWSVDVSGVIRVAAAEDFALGYIPLDEGVYDKYIKVPTLDRSEAELPSRYDARNDGIVTPAKNQGKCGSCWAFASIATFESHLLKKYGSGPYDLSEQQLLDCNAYGYSCSGGSSDAARYWETIGPVKEACYPYSAAKRTCGDSCDELDYLVTGWHTVARDQWSFKNSCYNEGPGFWIFLVYTDFSDGNGHGYWYDAAPGDVYVQTSSFYRGGHAVLLIGWDDAKKAYLCKNSWGSTGGPNGDGTFWIAYSGHAYGLEKTFGMVNFDVKKVDPCPDCSGGNVTLCDEKFPARKCKCVATSIAIGGRVIIPSGMTIDFIASSSISIGTSAVTIPTGTVVTFSAPIVTVDPGFHVERGAVVKMRQP